MQSGKGRKIRVGTSGWSYPDWVGPFYPEGTAAQAYLGAYAERLSVVEVDSTFYRLPTMRTVEGWASRTAADFRFTLKVPRRVTHGSDSERPDLDRVLVDDEGVLEKFLESLEPLGEKAAVVVFQFPYFRVREMKAATFLGRLAPVLHHLPPRPRFAVEIRNKTWIKRDYTDLLAGAGVAAVMIDHPYMPDPREQLEQGMVSGDFAYVRLLGDRYAIERKTQTWGEIVEDRTSRLERWADVLLEIAAREGIVAAWVFANNHFAGHAPATCRELEELIEAKSKGGML